MAGEEIDADDWARLGPRHGRRSPRATPAEFDLVLVAAQCGETWALGELFGEYGGPLLAFFRSQRVRDSDAAANEVLLRVFRSLPRFAGGQSDFRSWVFTIAHNFLLDERRRSAKEPRQVALDSVPDTATDGDDSSGGRAVGQLGALQLLARLNPDQREVLVLRFVADLSIEDVAVLMRRRVGAVKALQRRALDNLRREIAK